MSQVESKIGQVRQSDEKLFNFFADFNNFQRLIPTDKIKNWSSTTDTCSFTVVGIGDAGLKIIEKKPFSLIKITSEGKTPIDFFLWIQIKKADEKNTRIRIIIEPLVNIMMMGMLQGPMQSFVDMLIDQLENLNLE